MVDYYATHGMIILTLYASVSHGQDNDGQFCTFVDHIINSSTISKFPSISGKDYCYRVNGSIRIERRKVSFVADCLHQTKCIQNLDETTNLTHDVLLDSLGGLKTMIGVLEIVNTEYTNLSFFRALFAVFKVDMSELGYNLIIMNNSKLETMDGGALLTITANVRIENNPLLNPNCDHVLQYYTLERRIRGNRLNCGCELDFPITTYNINDVDDNCTAIFGNLYLFGPNVPPIDVLMRKFAEVTLIGGEIAVVNTDYEDLSFLGNLEIVIFYYSRFGPYTLERFVRIENNAKLKMLSWPKLKEVTSATILIAGNPNLCCSVFELDGLFKSRFFDRVEAKICEEIHPKESGESVCRIDATASVSHLPANCRTLIGHLTIDHTFPEQDLWKLYNVSKIYGSLTIRNSSLKGFSPLWKLTQLYNPSGQESALIVDSNKHLKSIYVQKFDYILSDLPVRIANNPQLDMSRDECNILSYSGQFDFRGNMKDCLALAGKFAYTNGIHVFILLPFLCGLF